MSAPTTLEKRRSIFDIDNELDAIASAFDQMEELGTEAEYLKAVENYFGDLITERDTKLDNYARFLDERSAIAKARKDEAARLTALAKTDEALVKRCKETLKAFMDMRGMTKTETALHKFTICANGGKTPVLIAPEVDPSTVDPAYQVVTVSIDSDAVRSDLEAGKTVPFATLGERGSHLRIK